LHAWADSTEFDLSFDLLFPDIGAYFLKTNGNEKKIERSIRDIIFNSFYFKIMLTSSELNKINEKYRIVLASGSPRRKELLKLMGLKFDVIVSTFDEESLNKKLFPTPIDFVKENSKQKALNVWKSLMTNSTNNNNKETNKIQKDLVIFSADTIVYIDDTYLEKPKDRNDAIAMLRRLSGRQHFVISGVTMIFRSPNLSGSQDVKSSSQSIEFEGILSTFSEITKVNFTDLTDDVIESYVDTLEPMDKSGGYGIQGIGGTLIEGIEGNYYNIMGLPTHNLAKEIKKNLL